MTTVWVGTSRKRSYIHGARGRGLATSLRLHGTRRRRTVRIRIVAVVAVASPPSLRAPRYPDGWTVGTVGRTGGVSAVYPRVPRRQERGGRTARARRGLAAVRRAPTSGRSTPAVPASLCVVVRHVNTRCATVRSVSGGQRAAAIPAPDARTSRIPDVYPSHRVHVSRATTRHAGSRWLADGSRDDVHAGLPDASATTFTPDSREGARRLTAAD